MAAPTGNGLAQPSQRKVLTRLPGPSRVCASISEQRAALSASAALACFGVLRARSSGASNFKCGAESLSHLRRMLWTWAKIAATPRPLRSSGLARHGVDGLEGGLVDPVVDGIRLEKRLAKVELGGSNKAGHGTSFSA